MTTQTLDGRAVLDTANNAGLDFAEATALVVVDAIARQGYEAPLHAIGNALGVPTSLLVRPLRSLVRRKLLERTKVDLGIGRARAWTVTDRGAYLALALRSAGGRSS